MLTVGIDAHKRQVVIALVDATGRVLGSRRLTKSDAALPYVTQWLSATAPGATALRWGIEGSGTYGRQLAQALVAAGYTVFEVPGLSTSAERHRSRGREREKTDVTDAVAIGRVVLRDADRLPRVQPDGAAYQCRLLSEHRDNLIHERTRLLNQLYAHLAQQMPMSRPVFRSRNHRQLLSELANAPLPTDPLAVTRTLVVRQLAALIHEVDVAVADLTAQLVELAPRVAPTLLRIPGCAALTATKLLGEAGAVARFASPARFAAYAGTAPLEASSGDRRRHRLSRRGNRQLNCALHTIAVTQRRWHPIGRAFIARKLSEGKSRREALRSLKRHLANVVYRALIADRQLAANTIPRPLT
jgi:transposase